MILSTFSPAPTVSQSKNEFVCLIFEMVHQILFLSVFFRFARGFAFVSHSSKAVYTISNICRIEELLHEADIVKCLFYIPFVVSLFHLIVRQRRCRRPIRSNKTKLT